MTSRPNDIRLPVGLNRANVCRGAASMPLTPLDEANAALWRHWIDAAITQPIHDGIQNLLDTLTQDLAQRKPVCNQSGKCCRFESYGHRLYVTGLETAWTVRQLDTINRVQLDAAPLPRVDGCPFQISGLCGVHTIRPMGCRVYFCDPNAQAWQNDVYETYQTRIRQLHEQHNIPYRYMDWRAALDEARRALTFKKRSRVSE